MDFDCHCLDLPVVFTRLLIIILLNYIQCYNFKQIQNIYLNIQGYEYDILNQ